MDFSTLFEKIIEKPVTNTLTPFPPDCIRLHQEVFLFINIKKIQLINKLNLFYLDISSTGFRLSLLLLNPIISSAKIAQLKIITKYKNNSGRSDDANSVGDRLIAIPAEKVTAKEPIATKLFFDLPSNKIITKTIITIIIIKITLGPSNLPVIL